MGFVPNHEHDVFVSYAHRDNKTASEAEEGRVSTLVNITKVRLEQMLGSDVNVWMDYQLPGNDPITDTILGHLQHSATLLVILSPSYLQSPWCQRESNNFLDVAKKRCNNGSIFVVEIDKIDVESAHLSAFIELHGYKLWIEDSRGKTHRLNKNEEIYYTVIEDLCCDLRNQLRRIKSQGGTNDRVQNNDGVNEHKTQVFLAETTDDLDPKRNEVKAYLEQFGLKVLPDRCYPRKPEDFQKSLDEDLNKCKLFIQLLSELPGKKSPDLPQGYIRLQYERALHARIPIIQWRSSSLEMDTVIDIEHKELLERDTVRVIGLEQFKAEAKEQAFYKPQSSASKPSINAFVFVARDSNDMDLTLKVCKYLEDHNIAYSIPLDKGTPEEIREDLEQNLIDCDALIVIYGHSTVAWVNGQLRQSLKSLHARDHPLQAVAIFEGPPIPKEPLTVRLPIMHYIHCSDGLKECELNEFFNKVQIAKANSL